MISLSRVETTQRKGETMTKRFETKQAENGNYRVGNLEGGTLAELRKQLAKVHGVEPRQVVLVVTR